MKVYSDRTIPIWVVVTVLLSGILFASFGAKDGVRSLAPCSVQSCMSLVTSCSIQKGENTSFFVVVGDGLEDFEEQNGDVRISTFVFGVSFSFAAMMVPTHKNGIPQVVVHFAPKNDPPEYA